MLEAGDLIAVCRRILCSCYEDVGLAYPNLGPIVKSCVDSALQLGLPEGRLPLLNAVILIATAPKSNSAYFTLYVFCHILLLTLLCNLFTVEVIKKIWERTDFPDLYFYLLYGLISDIIIWIVYLLLSFLEI